MDGSVVFLARSLHAPSANAALTNTDNILIQIMGPDLNRNKARQRRLLQGLSHAQPSADGSDTKA